MSSHHRDLAWSSDLDVLLKATRRRLASAQQITRRGTVRTIRFEMSDGTIFKGRQFATPDKASLIEAVYGQMNDTRFPQIVGRNGCAILETWICGTVLDETTLNHRAVRECGSLLGLIHATTVPSNWPFNISTRADIHGTLVRQIGTLHDKGLADWNSAEALQGIVLSEEPECFEFGFTHRDFGPDNLVMSSGKLYSIDNTTMRVATLDQDLARTRLHWRMDASLWDAFLDGYQDHRDPTGFLSNSRYWAIAELVRPACWYLAQGHAKDASRLMKRLLPLIQADKSSGLLASCVPPSIKALGELNHRNANSETAVRTPPDGHALRETFEFGGLTTSVVTSRTVQDLNWLREMLMPQFQVGVQTEADWQVELRLDDAEFDRQRDRCRASAEMQSVDCFSLDGEFDRGLVCGVDGGVLSVLHEQHACLFHIDRVKQHVEIVSPHLGGHSRLGIMRVMRELATAHCQRRHLLHIHGSAFELDGNAIIATGPKRAGKTSFLLQALGSGDCRFIANDRLFLFNDGDRVIARGMPTIVKVRPDCRVHFPRLYQEYQRCPYDYRETMREALESRAGNKRKTRVANGRPLAMSQAQFCDLLDVAQVATSTVAAIVFPEIDRSVEKCQWRALSPGTAARRLAKGLLVSGSPMRITEAFRLPGDKAIDQEAVARTCLELATRIPCFSCRLGSLEVQPMLDAAAKAA